MTQCPTASFVYRGRQHTARLTHNHSKLIDPDFPTTVFDNALCWVGAIKSAADGGRTRPPPPPVPRFWPLSDTDPVPWREYGDDQGNSFVALEHDGAVHTCMLLDDKGSVRHQEPPYSQFDSAAEWAQWIQSGRWSPGDWHALDDIERMQMQFLTLQDLDDDDEYGYC